MTVSTQPVVAPAPVYGQQAAGYGAAQPVMYAQPVYGQNHPQMYAQPSMYNGQPILIVHAQPQQYATTTTQHDWISILIFVLGCLCCPIWCGGWFFLRSPSRLARGFGLASLLLSLVVTFLVIVIFMSASAHAHKCQAHKSADTCFSSQNDCQWCTDAGACYASGDHGTAYQCYNTQSDLCHSIYSESSCNTQSGCHFCDTYNVCIASNKSC